MDHAPRTPRTEALAPMKRPAASGFYGFDILEMWSACLDSNLPTKSSQFGTPWPTFPDPIRLIQVIEDYYFPSF